MLEIKLSSWSELCSKRQTSIPKVEDYHIWDKLLLQGYL